RRVSRASRRLSPGVWLNCRGERSEGSAALPRGRAVMAALLPDGEALDDDEAAAIAAPAEAQLVAARQACCEKDRILERDRGRWNHGGVGLERSAERVAADDVGECGTGGGRRLCRHQAREREKARQHGGFLLDPQRACEVGGLVRRLAAMTGNITGGAAEIGPIDLADAVIAEPGPDADGLRARLVSQETQRQLEALPIAIVPIFRDAHGRFPPPSVIHRAQRPRL